MSTPPKTKLFVGKLPPACNDTDLRKLFERYGEVTECSILGNYAFVHMKDESSASNAITNLNNWDLNGFKISVEPSTGEKRSGGSRGGGRGGFRGGDRGGGRGGFRGRGGGPMRGGRGMGGRPSPYDRRPMGAPMDHGRYAPPPPRGPPPPAHMNNGYEDYYDRRERSDMGAARPPPVAREPYRESYESYDSYDRMHTPHAPPMRRSMPMDRRLAPAPMTYDRGEDPYESYAARAPATDYYSGSSYNGQYRTA